MSQVPADSECTALTHLSMCLARKYVNLNIKEQSRHQRIGHHYIFLKKKEDRLYMKSPTLEAKCAKGVFQTQPPTCDVNFSNNISITQVRINERKN